MTSQFGIELQPFLICNIIQQVVAWVPSLRGSDLAGAVKTIAEQCSVNVDVARLKCQAGS